MDPIRTIPIRRFEAGRFASKSDTVISEVRVELDIDDGRFSMAMLCLPQDLKALAIGFLLGEGAIRRLEDIREVKALESQRKIMVRGDFDADALEAIQQRWTWGLGCGGGGTGRSFASQLLTAVGPGLEIKPERLLELMGEFNRRTVLWRQTGGVHACALSERERIILFAEDVGRHNAFDKVVGMAALDGIDLADKLVLMTGRLSAEIVSKAVTCGLSVLASRGAVTHLAVELARRYGLTLVGFARGGRLNVYTGYQRIAVGQETPPDVKKL